MGKRLKGPLWFALMRHWVDTDRGKTGLTLPFLVGALWRDRGAAGKPDALQLSNLLFAFQTRTPAGCFIKIKPTDLHQPVAKAYQGDAMSVAHTIELAAGPSRLSIEDYKHTRTIDSAFPSLWILVGDAIREGRFSYSKAAGRYVEFTADETAFIDETKSLIKK
jgi:hypothetical protein